MILWCDGAHGPGENMARDVSLLAAAEAGHEPVLRLFRFEPHGITLGASQRPERELDLARCEADGIPWAIRPTGGRAIFHAEEWTYSLTSPLADPLWGGSQAEAYSRMSVVLVASLVRLGVPARFAAGTLRGPGVGGHAGLATRPAAFAADPHVAPPCFASMARHEVTLDGRKLVGSAQRRTARALLQQGSVLLGDGHLRLAEYLALDAPGREIARESLRRAAAVAAPSLAGTPVLERWADSLEAVLTSEVRRVDGTAMLRWLALESGAPYTAVVARSS